MVKILVKLYVVVTNSEIRLWPVISQVTISNSDFRHLLLYISGVEESKQTAEVPEQNFISGVVVDSSSAKENQEAALHTENKPVNPEVTLHEPEKKVGLEEVVTDGNFAEKNEGTTVHTENKRELSLLLTAT